MASAEAPFEEDLKGLFDRYRASLRRQFCRHCLTYSLALFALLAITSMATWALIAVAFWTVMLCLEAKVAFGTATSIDCEEFGRWRRRQDWVAARNGDRRSLNRLQNVQ